VNRGLLLEGAMNLFALDYQLNRSFLTRRDKPIKLGNGAASARLYFLDLKVRGTAVSNHERIFIAIPLEDLAEVMTHFGNHDDGFGRFILADERRNATDNEKPHNEQRDCSFHSPLTLYLSYLFSTS